MHYIDTLKQELSGTKAYEQTSEKEKSVINNHIFHNATRFAVSVNEDKEGLPTFYWLPKLHKKHIRLDLLLILAHARLPNYYLVPHNLIKDKLVDIIEITFQREGSLYIACNDRNAFFTSDAVRNYNLRFCQKVSEALTFLLDNIYIRLGPVRKCVKLSPFS